jgi:hypothetical protein
MTRQISNHFGSSQGMTDQDDILQVECIHDSGDVIGKGVEIVPATRLLGTPMTPPVECDTAPSPFGKNAHRHVPPI